MAGFNVLRSGVAVRVGVGEGGMGVNVAEVVGIDVDGMGVKLAEVVCVSISEGAYRTVEVEVGNRLDNIGTSER